jgi:hypothetical protein
MVMSLQEVGMQRMQGAIKEHYNEGPVKPMFQKYPSKTPFAILLKLIPITEMGQVSENETV